MPKRFIYICLLVLSLPAWAESAIAQDPVLLERDLSAYEGRPRVRAVKLEESESISVDGRLDEPIWQRALPATDFIQQDPDNGAPATERTEVRFAFSRDSLYMGVICYDSEPEKWMGN